MNIVENYKPKIGLCMIVKDEAHVIIRCLNSVKPLIDFVLIEDTGSTDGTQNLVSEWLTKNHVSGYLYERTWVNFSHNRSSALATMREQNNIDYALIMDADDVLLAADYGLVLQQITTTKKDAYRIPISGQGVQYFRTQIVSNRRVFYYIGVLHEYIEGPEGHSSGTLAGLKLLSNREGSRSKDPDKYKKDAEVLSNALLIEKNAFLRARYTFYLAQSQRDAGQHESALQSYLARSVMGYWTEESYVSLLFAGRLMMQLNYPAEESLKLFQRACSYVADRLEAKCAACHQLRLQKKYEEAVSLGLQYINAPEPKEGLFVESWVYEYGLKDEVAISAYWCGRYELCLELCTDMLNNPNLPIQHQKRVVENGKAALKMLNEKAVRFSHCIQSLNQSSPSMKPKGGTELMVEGLFSRLKFDRDVFYIAVNTYDVTQASGKTLLVWVHHDYNQAAVQWMKNKQLTRAVHCFVFVSEWQKKRFIDHFQLDPVLCRVLKNASATMHEKLCKPASPIKLVYASTPFRGLDVLLNVWEAIEPTFTNKVELHIFSSMKLYAQTDQPYQQLIDKARKLPNCTYHGVVPNPELKQFMLDCHILAYPSTFEETSCLAAIDAMCSGLRVIAPDYGALKETCQHFGRIYPWQKDKTAHQVSFTRELTLEINHLWDGQTELMQEQIIYCRSNFSWESRIHEWETLLRHLNPQTV